MKETKKLYQAPEAILTGAQARDFLEASGEVVFGDGHGDRFVSDPYKD